MTRRLLLGAVALVAVVLLVLTVPLAVVLARAERDRLAAAVQRDAMVLAGHAEATLQGDASADLAALVAAYRERTGARVVIVDAAGMSVADSSPPPGEPASGRDFSTRDEVAEALAGGMATGSRFSSTLDAGFLYAAVPVASGETIRGAVRISYPTGAVEERIRRSRLALLGIASLALAAAALTALLFGRWSVVPLRSVERAAGRMAAGDLTARAREDAGPSELRALAATLNTMVARLEDLLATQRSFVADASHQLRTPLTALRLRLEGLELSATPEDAAELTAAIDEVARLNRMVDGLLTLARAESARPATSPIDASTAVSERADAWEALAHEQGVRLIVRTEPAPVLAVEGALEQVLDNLIANALRYSPPDSAITLTAERTGDRVEMSVSDEGPGMPPAERERATDRFWRTSGAIADDGFGLGLAIVQRLVRASGGDISLEEAPGGGLDVRVQLRAAPSLHRSALADSTASKTP